ncbi:MAG: hypothetical protein M1508_13045 [Nitrospirae bacterium]|nr:hypothetical protein [Nitrospirota bacterium]
MLKGKIIDKALSTAESIGTDRSRCLRMRFNRNLCSGCTSMCRSGAITIDEDVHILADNCSECMLCVSACPSDSFEIRGSDFYSLLGRLRKIQSSVRTPVLGCNIRTDAACHGKTFCFGFLSEEHVIALSVFMGDTLQIDMTGCADCRNGFIVDVLKKRIERVETKTSLRLSDRIKLVHSKADLDFQEIAYDRRGFFKALKNLTFMQAAGLFDNDDSGEEMRSYSLKKLPFKRELLNRALKVLPEEAGRGLVRNYYYTVGVTENCNNCFACIGMCPAGALKIEETGEGRELFFSSSLCNGCGLCQDFCMTKSVRIEKGFSGDNPFGFSNTKREVLCTA